MLSFSLFYSSATYYFTPIIICGCLSVNSGVIVAFLHHRHTSSKGKRFSQLGKTKQEDNINYKVGGGLNKSERNLIDSECDNDDKEKQIVLGSKDVVCEVCSSRVMIKDKDKPRTSKDIASVVDKTLMVLCLFITVVSMVLASTLILDLR